MASKDDYLNEYREFFENFAKTLIPDDPLPVKPACYRLVNVEVVGGIVDWTMQYLTQKKCPENLLSHLIKIVIDEVRSVCKLQPVVCGFEPNKDAYEPLKLMQTVMSKVNEICLRYLQNENLCSLPSPGPPFPQAGSFACKNSRRKMEDRHVVIHDLNTIFNNQEASPSSYYAIFDGHAGASAAAYSAAHLHQFLAESKDFANNPEQALRDAFRKTDLYFEDKCTVENFNGGTTAVCALHRPKEKKLYIAWAGDSLAILARKGEMIPLVNPHKPSRDDERKRIEDLGGTVTYWGTWRVNGLLAVSRAIGDVKYKPFVVADPDIQSIDLDGTEDFLILASDGLWDFMPPKEVVHSMYNYVNSQIVSQDGLDCLVQSGLVKEENERNELDPHHIAKELCKRAKSYQSNDNVSVIFVFLRDPYKIEEDAKVRRSNMEIENTNTTFFSPNEKRNSTVFDDDMGPETPVDDEVMSPTLEKVETNGNSAFAAFQGEKGLQDLRDETPTPPPDDTQDGSGLLVENVAESGDDSDDEWNYFQGDQKGTIVEASQQEQEVADFSDRSSSPNDAMSQLNPDAAEFVPISPTRAVNSPACRSLINETVLAQSPRRVPNEINDINLPNENEFASEIKSKPSELCSSNGHTTEAKLTSQEIMENFLNGKSNLDEIEFQPSTPKRGHNPEEFHFGPNATPFSTPAKMLDQSEAFSTKANFGDESTASYLDGKALESSFADTTAFGNEDNVDFQHLNKESDPMSMSFYQDKDDTRDPFDLNKVQVLPENLDDFLEKQDTVQQHFSEAEKLIDNKENIEMLVETTREVVENNAHNDLLDFCSMKPEEKQNDIEGICELPKSPVPTNDHLETSTPLPVATDSEDNFELHTAPAVCDLENRNSTNPFEMDMDMNKVEEEKGEKEDLQCEKEDIEKHRSEAESPNEEITSSVKDEIMSPVVSPAGKDLTEEISEAERDNSIASPELKELLSPVQKELKFEMENEKDIASPDITSPPAEEEIVEHECGLEAGVNYAQELTNAVQEALTTEISSPIPDNYAQSPVPSEPISEHEKVQDDLMACEFSAKKEEDLLLQKEEDIEPVCQLKPQEAFVETTPTDLSSPLKSDEDVLNKFEGEHMNLDIKTEFVQPEFPIQAIATPSETEDINQQFINQIKDDKPQDDFAACCSVLESAEDKVQEEQLIAEEVIAKTEEMVEKLVENDIIHPELMCEKVTTEDFRHDDRIEDNFVEEVKPPVEESKPVEEIKFEDEIKPVQEEVKPVEEIKDVVEEEIKPVETVMQEEIKPVENIMQEEIKPVENIMQEEIKPVENIMHEEIKPVENIMQEEIKPVENVVQEEVKPVEEVKLAEEEIKTDVKVDELIADVCEKKVDEVVEQVCEKVAEVCEKVPEVCEKAPEVLPEVCEKLPEVCSKPEEKIAEPKVEEVKAAAAAAPLLAEKKADAKKVDDKKAAPKAKAPISKAKSVSSPTKTTATKSPLATKAATPKSAPATKASTPTAAKPLTKTASATKTSVTKTTTSTTAKTPTKPRTSLASRTTPSTSDKKPITNGDVKASPKTTTTTTPTAIKKTTTTTTRTSTLASAKPAAPKTSTDAKTSARPTSAPAAKATPPSRLSLGAAPKPRPTTLKPTPPKMSTNAAVKSTTVTRTTSLTSPKSTTAATTKPRTTTGLTARPKTTTTLSKTAPKAADSEKQIKDSVNKMTASKTTTSSRTSTSAGARTTTTVRKTETKTPATRTTTKTTVTTIKSAKKPVEIIRNPAKAKTTAINKDVQSPKENGISQTTVIEQITTTMVTSAEMEPQLLKDNSPVENNVILDNQIQEATIAD